MKPEFIAPRFRANLLCLAISLLLILMPSPFRPAAAQTFALDRLWPMLQQNWYFSHPNDVAVSRSGHVFVADTDNRSVKKFTADGHLVTEWRGLAYPIAIAIDADDHLFAALGDSTIRILTVNGEEIGSITLPDSGVCSALAVGNSGEIYAADKYRNRVYRFSARGVLQNRWDGKESGAGGFDDPRGIAVDETGNVYVSDSNNHRIQKFTADGIFIETWGTEGKAAGQFKEPAGMVFRDGILYIVDMLNDRVQCFDTDGEFLFQWGEEGSGDGQLYSPTGIAADEEGYVYIADRNKNRIQKFTRNGDFMANWESRGSAAGKFDYPLGITVDAEGFVYAADAINCRIQMFDPQGAWQRSWGKEGGKAGELDIPYGVAADGEGNLYVSDTLNNRVQIFHPDGTVTVIGGPGKADGEFDSPAGIAADGDGFLYVADWENSRIQKFNSGGEFKLTFGIEGEGRLNRPRDIAVDQNHVYVADTDNGRIVKFDKEGRFIGAWGIEDDGLPTGIGLDRQGNVYVADSWNHRIKIFDPDGNPIAAFGEQGSSPGQFNEINDVAVGPDGRIYVTDTGNNRIQVFRPQEIEPDRYKAIIVAGGGPYPGNHLWDATRMCAHFAYRALNYRGFSRETIYFLSEDTLPDLDNNGRSDDVDAIPSPEALQEALTQWAADADQLVLYLVDHGGPASFRLSKEATLSAQVLDQWLDRLQEAGTPEVIIIYDACQSGSFLSELIPPSTASRIVIGSTSPEESAYFISQGSISFSNYFWLQVFSGKSVGESFERAREAVGRTSGFQYPVMDDNGDGYSDGQDGNRTAGVFIGSAGAYAEDAPLIAAVSPDLKITRGNSGRIYTDQVTDPDGVARVWAVIRPPGYQPGASNNAISALPSVDLMPGEGGGYEITYDRFDREGVYEIAIYARDVKGNTSAPGRFRVQVDDPLRGRAVIVAGGSIRDARWPAIENSARICYETLRFQGYGDEDIRFLGPDLLSTGMDGPADRMGLQDALTQWGASHTRDLVLYLVGAGQGKDFQLDEGESLSAEELKAWLDSLQVRIPGPVAVICDTGGWESIGADLSSADPPLRILIWNRQIWTSLPEQFLPFSQYFWGRIANGDDLYSAFVYAKNAIWYIDSAVPQLDDDGDGIGNGPSDGNSARRFVIGAGIELAGNAPIIDDEAADRILQGQPAATITAENVTGTGTIARVWAAIEPPSTGPMLSDPDTAVVELDSSAEGYSGSWDGFIRYGTYRITIYAEDAEGSLSLPLSMRYEQILGPDPFEPDDTAQTAGIIIPGYTGASDTFPAIEAARHNFHKATDGDWVKFYARAGQTYEIRTDDPQEKTDTVITLYDTDRETIIETRDDWRDGLDGSGELLSWRCSADGLYFVRITAHDPSVSGENTGYALKIYIPIQGIPGLLTGRVADAWGSAISNVVVTIDPGGAAITDESGYFIMAVPSGTQDITLAAPGFDPLTVAGVAIQGENIIYRDFRLQLPPAPTPLPNEPPVADAGPDQAIHAGEILILDGTGSYDPEGEAITFFWEMVEDEPSIAIPSPKESRISLEIPEAVPQGAQIAFRLTVTDIEGLRSWDICKVKVLETTPQASADAGLDQSILPGEIVSLDGSGSVLPEGGQVSIQWEQIEGRPVSLSDFGDIYPTFTAPEGDQVLVFRLVLTHAGEAISSDTCTVRVGNGPAAPGTDPVADAGPDQDAVPGEVVQLDGSGSSDAEGDIVEFRWEQVEGPAVLLSGPDEVILEFTAPMVEEKTDMVFQLTVADAADGRGKDTCIISVFPQVHEPVGPTVHAGADQTATEGETVVLEGEGSSALPDGILSFRWSQLQGPAVTLSDPDSAKTTFVGPVVPSDKTVVLIFRLTVEDENGLTGESEIFVTVADNGIRRFPDDVLSFATCTGRPLGIRLQGDGAVTALGCIHPSEIEETYNRPWNMIYGLIEIEMRTESPGTADIEIFLPEPAMYGNHPYRVFSYDPNTGWREIRHAHFNDTRDRLTIAVEDGGEHGAGSSMDIRFGLGVIYEDTDGGGSGSSSGGCFIRDIYFGARN